MNLERAIAGIFVVICLVYGYTAFVVMEAGLLPFERNMTFLPNVLPKWLSVLGVVVGAVVLIQSSPKADKETDPDGIDSETFYSTSWVRRSCCWSSWSPMPFCSGPLAS